MSVFEDPWQEQARRRHSAKWSVHGPDVLPAWVAEMDVRLAEPITARLQQALDDADTGYAGSSVGVRQAFAGFAQRRWQWQVDAEQVRPFADVGVAVTEVLRRLVTPGDRVLITTPVYPSFSPWLDVVRAEPVAVPLLDVERGGRLDLAGIEAALADGVRIVLLCSPHNPLGLVHTREELTALAAMADEHGAVVLSDEIHAPLVHPREGPFVPYLEVSDAARRTGIAFHSASKAWNLAGLKCALGVTARPDRMPADLPEELSWAVGHWGQLAAQTAFEEGEPWLDGLLVELAGNAALLTDLLAEHLPTVGYAPPRASYLAWLDCRSLGLGDDPAQAFLSQGRVALSNGPAFGANGAGWARLNLGTSPATITEAVRRMALARP